MLGNSYGTVTMQLKQPNPEILSEHQFRTHSFFLKETIENNY